MSPRNRMFAALGLIAVLANYTDTRAQPVSETAFVYQGLLQQNSQDVTEQCDFNFSLWTDSNNPQPGTQLGSDITLTANVDRGIFNAELDFGSAMSNPDARWLQIAVCCSSPCAPAFTVLSPRQPITSAPYSIQTRGIHVADNGNVGIGTNSPAAKLDVVGVLNVTGDAQASGDVTGGARLCIAADCRSEWPAGGGSVTSIAAGTGLSASPASPITSTGTLSFNEVYGDGRYARLSGINTFSNDQTVNASLTVSKPNGNALTASGDPAGGIGMQGMGYYGVLGSTTAPGFGVGVAGDGGSSGTGLYGLGLTGVHGQGTDSSGSNGVFGVSSSATGSGGRFRNTNASGKILSGANSADVEVFTVAGSGNVGIGTTTPLNKLDVIGTASASTLSANALGIGTTTPFFPLHILKSDQTGTGLQSRIANTATTGNSFATFSATANNGALVSLFSADGLGTGPLGTPGAYLGNYTNQPLGFITGNVERMRITAQGRVGIGTTNPQYPLDVLGGILFGGSPRLLAAGATEGLRIVRGRVNGDGTCDAGAGITCSRLSEGRFRVTFGTAFAAEPVITATVRGSVSTYSSFVMLVASSESGFDALVLGILESVGNLYDYDFNFVAVGPP